MSSMVKIHQLPLEISRKQTSDTHTHGQTTKKHLATTYGGQSHKNMYKYVFYSTGSQKVIYKITKGRYVYCMQQFILSLL